MAGHIYGELCHIYLYLWRDCVIVESELGYTKNFVQLNEFYEFQGFVVMKMHRFHTYPNISGVNRWGTRTFNRVANVVADHNDLLTQWRPIKMSKFRANTFLFRTTSNYFWASEVFKNQRFKSHLFSFSQYKKYPKLKTWVNFFAIIILY